MSVFFVVLTSPERCKLQLDLGPHPPVSGQLLVAHLRSRIKQELGCKSALDFDLYQAKDNAPNWKSIAEDHCIKLDDDEDPFTATCVYVREKYPQGKTAALPPPAHAAHTYESPAGFAAPKHLPPSPPVERHRSISPGRGYPGDGDGLSLSPGSQRRSHYPRGHGGCPSHGYERASGEGTNANYKHQYDPPSPGCRHAQTEGPHGPVILRHVNRSRSPPPVSSSRHRHSRDDWTEDTRTGGSYAYSADIGPSSDDGKRSSGYRHSSASRYLPSDVIEDDSRRGTSRGVYHTPRHRDSWSGSRDEGLKSREHYGHYEDSHRMSDSRGRLMESRGRRPDSPLGSDKRRRISPDAYHHRGLSPGHHRDSRKGEYEPKLEVNQISLFKLRPGRWAPVVHNLISKQDFLHDLHQVVMQNFDARGGKRLPFRIDSLEDIIISHDVHVPSRYSLRSVKDSREFRSLGPANREWLSKYLGNDIDPAEIADVDTSVCFLKIGNERLLVFDWYVYTLEHVAEYRKALSRKGHQPRDRANIPIFYVYGNPRIGKSICILFLAIAAAFCGEIVYFYCDSRVWTVSTHGPVQCTTLAQAVKEPADDEQADMDGESSSSSSSGLRPFIFAELRLKESESIIQDLQLLARNKNAVVVASGVPDKSVIERQRQDQFSRTRGSREEGEAIDESTGGPNGAPALDEGSGVGASPPPSPELPLLFVPPPAWHELCSLKILSYPGINLKEFVFRYFLFGPVPRNLISENGFDGVIDALKQAATCPRRPPWLSPSPDYVTSDPAKLTTMMIPVTGRNAEGGCGTSVTINHISRAAELVAAGINSRSPSSERMGTAAQSSR